MNRLRIKIGDRVSRVVGRDMCTTLRFILVGGNDWDPAQLWIESYKREKEEIKKDLRGGCLSLNTRKKSK